MKRKNFCGQIGDFISVSSNETGINQYNIVVTGQGAASSALRLSASDGKSAVGITITVVISLVVGLDEETVSYETYPNPTINYIVVKVKKKSSIVMYNTSGQVVLEDKVGSTDVTLSVGHLMQGRICCTWMTAKNRVQLE